MQVLYQKSQKRARDKGKFTKISGTRSVHASRCFYGVWGFQGPLPTLTVVKAKVSVHPAGNCR